MTIILKKPLILLIDQGKFVVVTVSLPQIHWVHMNISFGLSYQ